MTFTNGPRATIISMGLVAVMLSGMTMGANSAAAKTTKPKSKQPAGGANQVEGMHGKVGQMLFDGHWRFQVLGFQQADSYTLKVPSAEEDYAKYHDVAEYDDASHTFTPKSGYTFISVDCLAKNGQSKPEQLDFYLNDPNTALTDDQSNAYTPMAFDMMTHGDWVTKELIAGSSEHMTILFAVPPGTKPQNLVVTLKNWTDHKGHDFRIALAP